MTTGVTTIIVIMVTPLIIRGEAPRKCMLDHISTHILIQLAHARLHAHTSHKRLLTSATLSFTDVVPLLSKMRTCVVVFCTTFPLQYLVISLPHLIFAALLRR